MYVRVAFEGTPGLLGPRCLGLLPKHIAGRLAGKQGYGERRERRSTNPQLMIDPTRGVLPAGRRSSSFSNEMQHGRRSPAGSKNSNVEVGKRAEVCLQTH